jgi:DNA-directed RNA polymerase specialized sigma24 family protein
MDAVNREERRKWQAGRGVSFDPLDGVDPFDRDSSATLDFDEVDAINAAVDSLSTARARSVRACLMLGMSCSEFASTLGISTDAVKQTRRAGMEQLRAILSAQEETP